MPVKYYIQPGDDTITFDLPLTLAEIKHLHLCVATLHEAYDKERFISAPNEEMLSKVDGLINYLEKEHYTNHE
jgi:hypothetical protein